VASYTIGQAAKAAGVTCRAVRLYESKGLLPTRERTKAGYRLFTDADVEVLAFVRQGRSLGLCLAAIADIIRISEHDVPCGHTDALLAQRLVEIDAAIADLRGLRETIIAARRVEVDQSSGSRCAMIEQATDSNWPRTSVVVVEPMPLIEVRDGVRGGKPCFVGTRIAVYDVLEYLAGGMTTEQIVADFPELTEAHVRAALEFAARRERRLAESA